MINAISAVSSWGVARCGLTLSSLNTIILLSMSRLRTDLLTQLTTRLHLWARRCSRRDLAWLSRIDSWMPSIAGHTVRAKIIDRDILFTSLLEEDENGAFSWKVSRNMDWSEGSLISYDWSFDPWSSTSQPRSIGEYQRRFVWDSMITPHGLSSPVVNLEWWFHPHSRQGGTPEMRRLL